LNFGSEDAAVVFQQHPDFGSGVSATPRREVPSEMLNMSLLRCVLEDVS
jgi:hypothetical protein